MAFNTNIGKQSFTASSGQTDFTFNFKIYTNTDLKVYKTPSGQAPDDTTDILTLTTDYTVVVDGDNGGTVTLVSGATINDTLVILRDLPLVRTISYVENGDLVASTLNTDQDYQTYLIIDKSTEIANTVQLPKSVVGVSVLLPSVEADSYLKWNSTADALENDTTIPDSVVISTTQAGIATTKASEASISASEALGYRNEAEGFRDEAGWFALSIDPSQFVNLTTDQTKDGVLTFLDFPITPSSAPMTDYQVANKKYADDLVSPLSNKPSFSAYRATSAQAISATTNTKIQFNAEEFDTNNAFDNTTNFRFTPQSAGKYVVSAGVALSSNANILLMLYKNGSAYKYVSTITNVTMANSSGSCIIEMNGSTDYIEIYVYSSVLNNISNSQTQTFFQASKI